VRRDVVEGRRRSGGRGGGTGGEGGQGGWGAEILGRGQAGDRIRLGRWRGRDFNGGERVESGAY